MIKLIVVVLDVFTCSLLDEKFNRLRQDSVDNRWPTALILNPTLHKVRHGNGERYVTFFSAMDGTDIIRLNYTVEKSKKYRYKIRSSERFKFVLGFHFSCLKSYPPSTTNLRCLNTQYSVHTTSTAHHHSDRTEVTKSTS